VRGVGVRVEGTLEKSCENQRGRVQRTSVQRKKFRRPEVRVFFSGFLGRMVRGAGGELGRMVG